MATTTIIVGDVREKLAELAAGSVHCVVTSPPYWGLRRYLFDKAVVLRYDLSKEDRTFVLKELERRGIKARQEGTVC